MSATELKRSAIYSPMPMGAYIDSTAMIDTPQRWNLAFLSHDFEHQRFHRNPQFLVHVRRSSQIRLDGKGLDLVGDVANECVSSLLSEVAPRFVYLLSSHPALKSLPLYVAYGDEWLHTIERRARTHCVSDSTIFEELTQESVQTARLEIDRIRGLG